MGKFIWHTWARYVSIFACVYTTWAAIWGIVFRKFFWDFVDGTLAPNPNILDKNTKLICDVNVHCGIIPSAKAKVFISIIVNAPIIQILAMVMALLMLAVELVPYMKRTALHRSFVFKAVWLMFIALLACLFYQGTNGAIYSLTAAIGYVRAVTLGEVLKAAKDNRGNGTGGGKAARA